MLQCYAFSKIYCYIFTSAIRVTATSLQYTTIVCYSATNLFQSTATLLRMHLEQLLQCYECTTRDCAMGPEGGMRIYYDLLLQHYKCTTTYEWLLKCYAFIMILLQCYAFTTIYCYSSMHLLWSTAIVLRIYYDLPLRCFECTTSECYSTTNALQGPGTVPILLNSQPRLLLVRNATMVRSHRFHSIQAMGTIVNNP